MPSQTAQRAAAARLAALDKQAKKDKNKKKKAALRTEATMGSRNVRREASSQLSQFKE